MTAQPVDGAKTIMVTVPSRHETAEIPAFTAEVLRTTGDDTVDRMKA